MHSGLMSLKAPNLSACFNPLQPGTQKGERVLDVLGILNREETH